jgi:photosystem II stability/assembly factor-like uncharacterized protein
MSALAANGGYVFAAGLDYTYPGNPPTYSYAGLYRSGDNGDSWTNINNGLSGGAYAFAATGNNLFAGTGGGVFLTTNNGDLWTSVNTGLTDMSIASLAVNNGYVFAGSSTGNIWRRPLSEMVAVRYTQGPLQTQKAFNLHLDCNNILKYTLGEDASVSLKVYDIRGRLIFSSANNRQSTGPHSLLLSAGRLSSGSYVVDFTAGSFRTQKRVAVM